MPLESATGQHHNPKTARPSLPEHLSGLDGLRALAVLAVLLYHSDLGWMPAGFLGVEVFFVVSGYLITWLLLSEWRQSGRIDLKRFWGRRARRLLPALFAMVAATLSFAIVFLPDQVAGLRGDVLAALGYVTNWYLILVQKSYFEAMGRPSLLQHLWSLAVEEQFYLLWPLLLALLLRLWRPRRVLFVALIGAALSALLMAVLYQPDVDPSRIYYGTDTRAAGLLIGAALAFVWEPGTSSFSGFCIPWRSVVAKAACRAAACVRGYPTLRRFQTFARLGIPGERVSSTRQLVPSPVIDGGGKGWGPLSPLLDVLGLVGLCILFGASVFLDEFQPSLYLWGFTLVAVTTALVIVAATHPRAHLGFLLDLGPLRWIGQRSYSIYLWHWPVFDLTRPQLDVPFSGLPLFVLRLAAAIALAELSFRFIETPARQGAFDRAWATIAHARDRQRVWPSLRLAGAVAGILLFSIALGASVVNAQPPPPPASFSDSLNTASADARRVAAATATPAHAAPTTQSPAPPTSTARASPAAAATLVAPATTGAPASTPAPVPTPVGPARPAAALEPAGVNQVTAIGDSVMLGASQDLKRAIGNIEVDAEVGRQVSAAISILKARRAANGLGAVVVIHVGNNGPLSARQLNDLMGVLAGVPRVVIVNDMVPRAWEGPNNTMLATAVKQFPNVVLVDWHTASKDHPDYFWKDGIHLRPAGARAYVDLITAAVNAP